MLQETVCVPDRDRAQDIRQLIAVRYMNCSVSLSEFSWCFPNDGNDLEIDRITHHGLICSHIEIAALNLSCCAKFPHADAEF